MRARQDGGLSAEQTIADSVMASPQGTVPARVWPVWPAIVLVAVYLLIASAYALVVPSWEAPDEPAHFAYVREIATAHTLPVDHPGALGEEHQPPLYYLISAVITLPADLGAPEGAFHGNPRFIWAGRGGMEVNAALHPTDETFPFRGQALGLRLAREGSVLMGAGTVIFIVLTGWEIFPTCPWIGLLAGILAAFNPQFLFVAGSVNNDNLVTLLATGASWQMIRLLHRPERMRSWGAVGLWIAGIVLTKLTGLWTGLVAGLLLLGIAWSRRSLALLVRGAGALLATVGPAVLLWSGRNLLLYHDPIGWMMDPQHLRAGPLTGSELVEMLRTQFRSFWGLFGWMDVPAPRWFDIAVTAITALSVAGLGVFVARGGIGRLTRGQRSALGLLALGALTGEAGILGTVVRGCNATCYQGRLLFPTLGALTLFLALGLVALLPRRAAPVLVGVLGLALPSVALYLLAAVIRPAYSIVPLPKWRLWLAPERTAVTFGQMFRLESYQAELTPDGHQLVVQLLWRADRHPDFDYSVAVHLIDADGVLRAQKDQAPGADRGYPPTNWFAGDLVADEHRIALPPDLPDGEYRLRISVYNWQNGRVLPSAGDGASPNGTVILGTVLQKQDGHWQIFESNG